MIAEFKTTIKSGNTIHDVLHVKEVILGLSNELILAPGQNDKGKVEHLIESGVLTILEGENRYHITIKGQEESYLKLR